MLTKEAIKKYPNSGRVLVRDDNFIYLLPHPALKNWISNYTITFPGDGLLSDQYSVLPHGSATLVYSCSESRISGNLFGAITRPVCVGQSANSCLMIFIVEFQPAGYFAFSTIPQKELSDLVFPFETVDPLFNRLLTGHLEMTQNIESLVEAVDKLLMAHLKTNSCRQEFDAAYKMIISSGGRLSVRDISQNVFYSQRHLNRIFHQQMGFGIKTFSELVRINKALHLLECSSLNLQQISMLTGFYDIPHLIRDFKTICGITPFEYRDKMSDFYSEIAKF